MHAKSPRDQARLVLNLPFGQNHVFHSSWCLKSPSPNCPPEFPTRDFASLHTSGENTSACHDNHDSISTECQACGRGACWATKYPGTHRRPWLYAHCNSVMVPLVLWATHTCHWHRLHVLVIRFKPSLPRAPKPSLYFFLRIFFEDCAGFFIWVCVRLSELFLHLSDLFLALSKLFLTLSDLFLNLSDFFGFVRAISKMFKPISKIFKSLPEVSKLFPKLSELLLNESENSELFQKSLRTF